MAGKIICLRIACCSNAISGFREIVGGASKLSVRTEQEPVSAGFPEWHSYTAGIDDANGPHPPVELHVSMAADDKIGAETCKERPEAMLRGRASEDIGVVSRRRVTEKNIPHSIDFHSNRLSPACQDRFVFRGKLGRIPADAISKWLRDFSRLFPTHRTEHHAIAVALNKSDRKIEAQQQVQTFARHRTRKHVAADYDFIRACVANFLENRLQGRKIPVNIVDRRDPHH